MDTLIYKYTDLVGLKSILMDSTLKFTKPEDFNDPFEFHDNLVDTKLTNKHLKQIVKEREHNVTQEGLKRKIQTYTNNFFDFQEYLKQQFLNIKQTTRICCFSETSNNQLMWAHYSDKHKGACIGFSKQILYSNFNGGYQINKVKYTKKIHPKNLSKYRDKAILHWIITKSNVWEYEKEIRIVSGLNPAEFIKFNNSSIKKVIFGCKMNDDKKNEIEDIIFSIKGYNWIKTSEMKISDKKFLLEENDRC